MGVTLLNKIEMLRKQMMEEANRQGSLSADRVVALSQELDKYLVTYQKIAHSQKPNKLRFSYNRLDKVVKTSRFGR